MFKKNKQIVYNFLTIKIKVRDTTFGRRKNKEIECRERLK